VNFKPLSSADAAALRVFPRGDYPFEVIEGEDKVSEAGNPMIVLKIKVTNTYGVSRYVTDYLLEKWPVKLRHAAEACGLLEQYEAGELAGKDLVGKTGKVTLTIEKDKKFPDKNVVADYVVRAARAGMYSERRKV
jgi:hypothetical protein